MQVNSSTFNVTALVNVCENARLEVGERVEMNKFGVWEKKINWAGLLRCVALRQ